MGWVCDKNGETKNALKIFVWEPLGKWPLKRLRRRWEDNIKIDLREMCYEDGRWMELAQEYFLRQALILAMLNLQVLLS